MLQNATPSTYEKPLEPFVQGRVVNVHKVSSFTIVEYERDGETLFHCFVKGENTGVSSSSLDHALLVCLGHAYQGGGYWFAHYASRMLRMHAN